jgi:hypothetical protein
MAYTTIPKSTDYFDTSLWTGNSTSRLIPLDFEPSFVWGKARSVATQHALFDAVRGATGRLKSDTTGAEVPNSGVTAFNSNGFTNGTSDSLNQNGQTFASWNWKAGTTSGIATNGSTQITPSAYSFNQTSGFSIVKYTGIGGQPKAIAHGLGVQPKMFIIKRSDTTGSWGVLPQQISTGHLYLEATGTLQTVNPLSGGVLADTVNFSVSNSGDVNASGGTYVAYCFADVQGFSKMGSYIGNGNAASPTFTYLGFKPSFVLIKNTTQADAWFLHDSKRDGFNDDNEYLRPNLTDAESSGTNRIRLLSNGFSVPTTDKSHNVSGNVYIYMAFAAAPLVGTNNVPATAR